MSFPSSIFPLSRFANNFWLCRSDEMMETISLACCSQFYFPFFLSLLCLFKVIHGLGSKRRNAKQNKTKRLSPRATPRRRWCWERAGKTEQNLDAFGIGNGIFKEMWHLQGIPRSIWLLFISFFFFFSLVFFSLSLFGLHSAAVVPFDEFCAHRNPSSRTLYSPASSLSLSRLFCIYFSQGVQPVL